MSINIFFFCFRCYIFNLWMVWPSQHKISTYYDPGCSASNSLFSISSRHFLCHFPICSLVSLVGVLTSVSNYTLSLAFSLPELDANSQTGLIVVLLCDLLYSYVLLTLYLLTCRIWWAPNNANRWQMGFNSVFDELINLIHRLFWVFMYHLFLL